MRASFWNIFDHFEVIKHFHFAFKEFLCCCFCTFMPSSICLRKMDEVVTDNSYPLRDRSRCKKSMQMSSKGWVVIIGTIGFPIVREGGFCLIHPHTLCIKNSISVWICGQ